MENLRLHRTKCAKLITNVIAPAMLTASVKDIGDSGFSLIIDESTDITTIKFLATEVKYYSKHDNEIKTEFLGFVEVYRATALALFESIKEYLGAVGLSWRNTTGLVSDGASNLCGKHHSLYALFKAEVSR